MNQDRNPVGWFEIYVADLERAKSFYETVLATSLTPLPSPDPTVELLAFPMDQEKTGACGALVKMKDHQPANEGCPRVLIYFSCIDCAEEESRVEAAGGKVHQPKTALGDYGFISIIVDTENNAVGLHSMK